MKSESRSRDNARALVFFFVFFLLSLGGPPEWPRVPERKLGIGESEESIYG